jgi:DNA-binding PadR family transcriptional regulator
MEDGGLIKSRKEIVNGKVRKYYRNTSRGNSLLKQSIRKVVELVNEITE